MADSERIELQLDLSQPVESAKQLSAALQTTKVDATAFGAALQALDAGQIKLADELGTAAKKTTEFEDALRRLDSVLKTVDDDELVFKNHVESTAQPISKLSQAVDKTEASTRNMGRATLDASRALQDFTQGGIGGVLNNIEGLATSLGGGPGLAGVMTAIGVAAYIAIPLVKQLWADIALGSNEVPKSTDKLTALNDQLKANKDRLNELKGQQSLTNAELVEFNRLTTESIELEKKSNDEKARRNALEAARKEEKGNSPESAEIVKAAIGEAGGTDSVLNDTQTALQQGSASLKEAVQRLDAARAQGANAAQNPLDVMGAIAAAREIGEAKKALKAEAEKVRADAERLVIAARGGDVEAIRRLADLNPGTAIGQATPEAIRAQNDEVDAVDAQGQRLAKGNANRRAAGAQVDALNQAGRENEAALGKEQQDDAAKARAKAIADVRRAARGIVADKPEMLQKQPMMDLIPEGADDAEQARAAAEQGMVARMQEVIRISNQRAMAGRKFAKDVDNLPVLMDEGNQ